MPMTVSQIDPSRYLQDFRSSVCGGKPLVKPLRATLVTTLRCNSRCSYCRAWRSHPYDTPFDDLKHVVSELTGLGVQALTLTGGEPLLQPHLPEIIKESYAHGIVTSVTTNGLLLMSDTLDSVLQAGLHVVTVSLDTVNPATYSAVRGVRLEPVLDGLERLLKMRQKYPGLAVSVNCIVTRANIDELVPLVEYCTARDISVGLQPVHFSRAETEGERSFFETVTYSWGREVEWLMFRGSDLPHLQSTIDQLIDMRRRGFLINSDPEYLNGFPRFLALGEVPENFICSAGLTTIAIDHELNVRACWPMEPVPNGNIRNRNIVEVWDSEEYQRCRCAMQQLRCPRCWLRCHTEWSESWVRGFLNWIAIRRASR